jgi:aspartate/methionine/tyrosine aminotransferase
VEHPFASQNATTVARRLADEFNVLCLPGSMFGEQQERFLRFAFANLEAGEIPELVRRLIASQTQM